MQRESEAVAQRTIEGDSQLSLLRNSVLLALSAGHGAVDLCANVLPIFYPLLVAALNLSYGSVGALTTVQSAASSLGQPFFGWVADRFGSRILAPAAVVVAGIAISLVGYAPGYQTLLLVVAVLGLAVGAWHPQGAKAATLLGGRWRMTSLSIYMLGGSAGYALGPLLAATVLVPAGLRSSVMLLVPALLVVLVLFALGGRLDGIGKAGVRTLGHRETVPILWLGVLALGIVIVIRAWVTYGMIAFVPLLLSARGEPPEMAGEMLFLLLIMEGAGTAVGGWLADRIGNKPTLVASFVLMAPAVHLFVGSGGASALMLAAAVGLLLGLSATITLVAAQEILPSRMGMASGIAISVSNVMGGVGVGVQGLLADHYGLLPSMEVLVAISLVAAAASLRVANNR